MGINRRTINLEKEVPQITMEKDKNLLIFTRQGYDYQVSFNLNNGEYCKIKGNEIKSVKNINTFFANSYYRNIIDPQQFPVYFKIVDMAGSLGWYLRNMGSVLDFLKKHLYWEQYLVLDIPISKYVDFPLSYFPKDVLKCLLRAIRLHGEFEEECRGWGWRGHTKYVLPSQIELMFHQRGENQNLMFNCIRYCANIEDDREFAETFSMFYGSWRTFVELVIDMRYEYKSLFRYIANLQKYEGYHSAYDCEQELYDYANMSSKIADFCGREGKWEKYPHFLKSRHQIVSANYNILEKEMQEDAFQKQYDGALNYQHGKYCIVEPKETKDILAEANAMHNCVASYISYVAEGRTKIVFMREKANKEESLVTVEVKNKHICQAYQANNVTITEEQREFLTYFANNKKLILDNV